jgi:hypothetical protein
MEILVAVVVGLGLYWAYSARRSSLAGLRYQLHKDLLAEAARIVGQYRRTDELFDTYPFDVDAAPLELQAFLAFDLGELADHVSSTGVTTGLGDPNRLRTLAEAVQRVHSWTQHNFPPETWNKFRARAVDWNVGQLRKRLADFDPEGIFAAQKRAQIQQWLRRSEAAIAWGIPGETITLAEAKAAVANARST